MNKQRIPTRFKYQPQGIEEFNSLEREWQREIEEILIGMVTARTDQGLAIASIDTAAFIAEYQKIVTEARNKVEHGVMKPGLKADLP
jgi:hypothetical protein